MNKIIVLFNLKDGVSNSQYEEWAKTTDLPIVNALPSVDRFDVLKSLSLLGSEEKPPYQYIEIIDIANEHQFSKDASTETMQTVASEFQTLADQPIFIAADKLAD